MLLAPGGIWVYLMKILAAKKREIKTLLSGLFKDGYSAAWFTIHDN